MDPLEIRNLKKSYGSVPAVKGVSFNLRKGEILGLIGPDGAGKTTIIRSVVSLLLADEGEILYMGKNIRDNPTYIRSRIGYMPQRFSLYPDLTVEENLDFFGDLFQVPKQKQKQRKEELYAFSHLGPFKKRRAADLSGGMKQKLALSCMLIHQPDVLILDEPTFGVDPVSRHEFWEILKTQSRRQGTSILVTTAYMDEAGQCDRVGLMFAGRILALDQPQELEKQFTDPLYVLHCPQPHEVFEQIYHDDSLYVANLFGEGVHITLPRERTEEQLRNYLQEKRLTITKIERIKPSLEDVFLKLMHG